MKIIGEKINGTRKRVHQAVLEKDEQFIKNLALSQAEAGADWIDANAGTKSDREPDDLIWLVSCIQSVTDIPVCLDSANPQALSAAIRTVDRTPMINSISGESSRMEGILPLAAEFECPVIALAMDDKGIPKGSEDRVKVMDQIISETRSAGLPDSNIYADPLVLTIATDVNSGLAFFNTVKTLSQRYPDIHFTSGLSNISFGLPARSLINRAFMTLAVEAGLDSAIMDPMDKDLVSAIYASELVLGRDAFCKKFTGLYRSGKI